jgi:hypothetical protein
MKRGREKKRERGREGERKIGRESQGVEPISRARI